MTALLRRHALRIAITLVPVLLALLQASTVLPLPFIQRLDNFLYDVRLRATMPGTLDPRIVIVDIDDRDHLHTHRGRGRREPAATR